MSESQSINALSLSPLDGETPCGTGDLDRGASTSIVLDGAPHIKVRVVAGFPVVDIVNTDVLFEEGAIRRLSTQLHGLVEEGATRLFLNFGGIRYMSSDVLATLAGLHLRVERRKAVWDCSDSTRCSGTWCICRLERAFDIYTDEEEALCNGKAASDGP